MILFHRYVGIGIGLLMVAWCLSGVVMMYVPFPNLPETARIGALAPIDWTGCCAAELADVHQDQGIGSFEAEMFAGRLVLRIRPNSAPPRTVDLNTGDGISSISTADAARVAAAFGQGNAAEPALISRDQWTVSGEFNADRPLYRVALNDAAKTEIYVSHSSGRAVQRTTLFSRVWSWLGAVPHWLYFTGLRQNVGLWSQVVIYTSLTGCFLTLTGLYIGIRQTWVVRKGGKWSPYRNFMLWHHIPGLVFGIFTLTWVMSGLFSMNPWGFLDGAGANGERQAIRGAPFTGKVMFEALGALSHSGPQPALVSINSAPLNGQLFVIGVTADGRRRRLDARGQPAPMTPAELSFIGEKLGGRAAPELLETEDTYYFAHAVDQADLPVYRVIGDDSARTVYYIDPVSGAVRAKMDGNRKGYRWLFEGLHRLDFVSVIRRRPAWDILMIILLGGVTLVCGIGTYLGFRRISPFRR